MIYDPPACCDMRGMLSFMILWLLSKKQMYGQELAGEIAKRKGYIPNPGTLYPTLTDLEGKGLIQSEQIGRKRTYGLTIEGKIGLKRACAYFYQAFGDIFEDYKVMQDITYEF
ncbi:MAG: PadR family transcriptional regulator [Methanocellales archaeon]|nr:PadR family transcriptional regulator [Methanocellales archaeon]MDD3421042.1 PadR family transcriptional regulator [Methanocellales archaeon]MDD5447254.1 PadR family transcriptional regulator [Methanocellales archaeon]